MIIATVVTLDDDLQLLVAEINAAQWDEANEMAPYGVAALRAYLELADTCFVACHEVDGSRQTLLGIASARLELKPYGEERWLYVDEVDVCANQRRRGAGQAIMRQLLEFARLAGCEAVWLGTEPDNEAANALYRSLSPQEEETFVGYTFELWRGAAS